MFSKMVSVALVAVLLQGSNAAETQPQSPSQPLIKVQRLLHKAQEKDKAVKVRLNKKIDNQSKFAGKVSELSDSGFTLTDQKTGKALKLSYEDVQEVKQKGISKGWTIALLVIAGVLIACVAIGSTLD